MLCISCYVFPRKIMNLKFPSSQWYSHRHQVWRRSERFESRNRWQYSTTWSHLLTVSVPLDLWLVAVQSGVNDDRAPQTHGLTLPSKRYTKLINNVSLEGDAILRHWAIYRQSRRQQSQRLDWHHCAKDLHTHNRQVERLLYSNQVEEQNTAL